MFDFNPDKLFVPPLPPPRETPPPERDSIQPLDADEIADLLGPTGPFAKEIPGYEHRSGQQKMVRAVVTAFNTCSHLMVEAGTGTGKSMAYLVPAIHWALLNNTPVVISTNTKNLQSQLFEKDLPLIRETLGHDINIALIKGRSNYLCLRKLMYMLEHADYEIRPSDRSIAETIIEWVQTTQTGDFTELDRTGRGSARRLAIDLVSTSEECAGRKCRHFRQCFLRRARAKSMAADIIIANHSLVFAEMSEKGQALPRYATLILDEAHNIEDAATRHFSIEISPARFRFPLRRLGHSGTKGKGLLASLLRQINSGAITGNSNSQKILQKHCYDIGTTIKRVEKKREPFFDSLATLIQKRNEGVRRITATDKDLEIWEPVEHTAAQLISAVAALNRAIKELTEALRELDTEGLGFHNEYIRDLEAQRKLMQEICDDISFVLDMDSEEYVYWVERYGPTADGARIWAAPISIGEQMYDELYSQTESIIFVSATLSTGGSFNFIKKRLGIERIPEERLLTLDAGSPFDHAGQSQMLVPMFMPEPGGGSDAEYIAMLGEFLAHLFRRIHGRGLVLFTSYSMLRETTAIVRERLQNSDIDVLAQGESQSREALIKQFREDVSSVLMGTHSFWEGVDIVGESLSCVVLARLPFPMFTEPIVAARCEQIEASGGNAFMHYTIPTAVIKFRQGFGRLIRHRNDRGIVIAADRRIVSKRYGHWFRRGVPATTIKQYDPEDMLDSIEAFLNNT